ncbi:glycogen synthase GlgA [Paenibacillus sp. FSL W7-1287]|uniref:glycogen synthase GlgA n=1 Tax=Paenibacillus sp. FSL W7-1287 TaxID=2954538 RepID=UPI0030F790FF
MNVLFATSEAVPIAKTGGLADVAGALPKALKELSVNVSVVMPKYGLIKDEVLQHFTQIANFEVGFGWRNQYVGLWKGELDGITYYLIDNEYYFKRGGLYGYGDDAERFVFFSVAVLAAAFYYEQTFQLVHCNDWQTGLIPFLLKQRFADHEYWAKAKSVFTIHNLMYQGIYGIEQLKELLGAGDEWFTAAGLEFYGDASCLKAGVQFADKLTTVSPTYALEIQTAYYGERMDSLLSYRREDLIGIVNGIDTSIFNPMNDPHIKLPYRHSLQRKRKNKLDLQEEMSLPLDETIPLIGLVSRLVEQKGLDLVIATLDELLQDNVQMMVLGAGDEKYERYFYEASLRHPTKFRFWLGYSDRVASRIYAGADMFAMPSRFEPCGLSQLISLQYRTVPIVRETGGLKDTVLPYNEFTAEGSGFTFAHYNAHEYLFTVQRAVRIYQDAKVWQRIVDNGSRVDYSWSSSAKQYKTLYEQLIS